jgi:TRAP-type C4-dicarboxylate transport system permease small subunit
MLKKFAAIYSKTEEYTLVLSLVVTVVIIFFQVVMRYGFNASLSWSEELTRYIFIWQIWLGASIGFRDRKHIKVEITKMFISPRGLIVMDIVAELIWVSANIYLLYSGTTLVMALMDTQSVSTALQVPMWIVYLALPFSTAALIVRQIHALWVDVVAIRLGKEGI